MKKVYDHAVIYNGVLYPAYTEIEVKEEKTVETETVKKPKKKAVKSNDNA